MAEPGLVIPVRFNAGAAPAELAKVGAAGQRAGDQVHAGMGKAGDGSVALATQLGGLSQVMSTVAAAGKSAMASVGQGIEQANEYCKQLAANFAKVRKEMQEIATLSGRPNTGAFTMESARSKS